MSQALIALVTSAASAAGIQIVSSTPAVSFAGDPTTRFVLALPATPARTLELELSDSLDLSESEIAAHLSAFLADSAQRLATPVPNAFLTLGGLPLTYSHFAWPFHQSTAGADTSLVHGQVSLAAPEPGGAPSPLHAKVAAAMTVTFREVVRTPEQPFAESFILNAIRKTFDQGQLELVKSGNRQPVPVTTRYYSPRSGKFVFNDTSEPQRKAFLAAKTFWLSGILGDSQPVWLLDPRDAQYLNSTVEDLKLSAAALAAEGLIALAPHSAYASATEALMARRDQYESEKDAALTFIKPTFNEEMRGGHTNM